MGVYCSSIIAFNLLLLLLLLLASAGRSIGIEQSIQWPSL